MNTQISQFPFTIRPEADLLQKQPHLRQMSRQLAKIYAHQPDRFVTNEGLQQMGTALWGSLDIDEPFQKARRRAGMSILPILIESDQPEIQQLAWETLYHPDYGFLGKEDGFALTRRWETEPPTLPPISKGPLRVMLFSSLPDNLDAERSRLDVEAEQAQLLEALTPWVADGKVVLEMPDDGRFSTFQRLVKQFKPQLLVLSGHGKFIVPDFADETAYGIFLFEDERGKGVAVRQEEIGKLFYGSAPQCLLLSACESGKGVSSEALTTGLAWHLSAMGIPHVVGMRESVLDRAGTLFARAFCDAVAKGERVDVAVQQGREAITTPLRDGLLVWRKEDSPALAEQSLGQWCLPMLLSHQPSRMVLDWDFTPEPPQPTPKRVMDGIMLPHLFVGRRRALRRWQGALRRGEAKQLLITGAGGYGQNCFSRQIGRGFGKGWLPDFGIFCPTGK